MTARNNLVTLVLIGCFAGSWSGVPALSDIRAGRGCTVAGTNRNRARTTNPTRRQVHLRIYRSVGELLSAPKSRG